MGLHAAWWVFMRAPLVSCPRAGLSAGVCDGRVVWQAGREGVICLFFLFYRTRHRTYLVEVLKVHAREHAQVHSPPAREHQAHVRREGPDAALYPLQARHLLRHALVVVVPGVPVPPAVELADVLGDGRPEAAELAGPGREGVLEGAEPGAEGPEPGVVRALRAHGGLQLRGEAPQALGHLGVAPVARLDHALQARGEGRRHDAVHVIHELGPAEARAGRVVAAAAGPRCWEVVPARHEGGHRGLHGVGAVGIAALEEVEVDRVEDAVGVITIGDCCVMVRLIVAFGSRDRVRIIWDVDVVEALVR